MMPRPGERPIDEVQETHRLSPTYWAIEEEVYGEEYLRGVNPCSPTSATDLQAAATALRLDNQLGLEDGIDYLAASEWIFVVARKVDIDD